MSDAPTVRRRASASRRQWLMSDPAGRTIKQSAGAPRHTVVKVVENRQEDRATLSKELSRGYSAPEVLRSRSIPFNNTTGHLPGLINSYPQLPQGRSSARAAVALAIHSGTEEVRKCEHARTRTKQATTKGEPKQVISESNGAQSRSSSGFARLADPSTRIAAAGTKWHEYAVASLIKEGGFDQPLSDTMKELVRMTVPSDIKFVPSLAVLPREQSIVLDQNKFQHPNILRRVTLPTNVNKNKSITLSDTPVKFRSVPRKSLPKVGSPQVAREFLDDSDIVLGQTEFYLPPDERLQTFDAEWLPRDLSTPQFEKRTVEPMGHWGKLVMSINSTGEEVQEDAGVVTVTPEKKKSNSKSNVMRNKKLEDSRRALKHRVAKLNSSSSMRSPSKLSSPGKVITKSMSSPLSKRISPNGRAVGSALASPPLSSSLPRRKTRMLKSYKDTDSDGIESMDGSDDEVKPLPRAISALASIRAARRNTVSPRSTVGSRSRKARINSGRSDSSKFHLSAHLEKLLSDTFESPKEEAKSETRSNWIVSKFIECYPYRQDDWDESPLEEVDYDEQQSDRSALLIICSDAKNKRNPNALTEFEEPEYGIYNKKDLSIVDLPDDAIIAELQPAYNLASNFVTGIADGGQEARTFITETIKEANAVNKVAKRRISTGLETSRRAGPVTRSRRPNQVKVEPTPQKPSEPIDAVMDMDDASRERAEGLYKRVCGKMLDTMDENDRFKVQYWAMKDFRDFGGGDCIEVTLVQRGVECPRCDPKKPEGSEQCVESIVLVLNKNLTWRKVRRLRHVIGSD